MHDILLLTGLDEAVILNKISKLYSTKVTVSEHDISVIVRYPLNYLQSIIIQLNPT